MLKVIYRQHQSQIVRFQQGRKSKTLMLIRKDIKLVSVTDIKKVLKITDKWTPRSKKMRLLRKSLGRWVLGQRRNFPRAREGCGIP